MRIIKVRTVVAILIFLVIGSLFHNANADTLKNRDKNKKYLYKRAHIFAVSDINGNGKSETIVQIPGEQNLFILRWNGIWFRKIGEIKTPFEKINDVAVGDVDNDGVDEIAVISGKELYIFEKEGNRFILDETKTTPLYGGKRFGKKEILEAMDKFVEEEISAPKTDEDVIFKLDFEKLEGKLVVIGDVDNDKKNEVVISKLTPIISDGSRYTVDILKWKREHFEVIYSYPRYPGQGDTGIIIDDLNMDNGNELMVAGSFGSVYLIKYNKLKNSFEELGGFYIVSEEEIHDQRIDIGMINNQKVLVYSIFESSIENWINNEWVNNGSVKIIYLNKDVLLTKLKEAYNQIALGEERYIWLYEFASKFPTCYVTERFEGIKGLVIGNLDRDKENELIVNTAAGAYIYGLKFNIALIISIIAGAILIIALAVFLFIRTRRKKISTTT